MTQPIEPFEPERYEFEEPPRYRFRLTRRAFVQCVGTGLLITWAGGVSFAQRAGQGSRAADMPRFHIGKDGIITAHSGKVEVGQGARTQIAQAVAEEFGVPLDQVTIVLADTDLVPDDGGTFGSRTTPSTIPTVRRAAAATRELLIELACKQWGVDTDGGRIENGTIRHADGKSMTLAKLAESVQDLQDNLSESAGRTGTEVAQSDWKVLGVAVSPQNAEAIVTGSHQYPSDIRRPGMLFGKVLRPPAQGAELMSVDSNAAADLEGVTVVHDEQFVGCVAKTSWLAKQAIDKLAATAEWNTTPQPSSANLYDYLKEHAQEGTRRSRSREQVTGDVDAALESAKKVVRAAYHIPYIQHAPMETRSAAAEWEGDRLTVWTGTQRPFDVRNDLAGAFRISPEQVRVIVPDSGGGFGGKHTADVAIEVARLAKDAGKPVSLQWTREEEFTWAYFRPAGLIEIAAALDDDGKPTAWDFTNYNSGGSGLGCPYGFANIRTRYQNCESPLREGSYRALASTANNFAREAFIDLLAAESGADPVEFRLAYLTEDRLKGVLKAAAEGIGWTTSLWEGAANTRYGIACGTEKGSFVATAAEVSVDGSTYAIKRLVTAFECGAIHNPTNLKSQIDGCVVMGLGAVLHERIDFENGLVANTNFKLYEVPRFEDIPEMETIMVERPDLASVGSGETPIIGVAPAIANAIRAVTSEPVYELPIRLA